MFEVPYGQDPYSAIGRYIRENITAIEDMIAVIELNGVETNELFLVDMEEDGFFVWKSDWYEGEKNVALIDFFPVSEAINSSAQPDVPDTNVGDMVYRQAAIDAVCSVCGNDCDKSEFVYNAPQDEQVILCPEHYCLCTLPSAQPKRIRGKWIDEGFYADGHGAHAFRCSECGGHIIEYDVDSFCKWCGADMRGKNDG